MWLPERGAGFASRECVGKTVTLQGNLDPCALYASEVTDRAPLCICYGALLWLWLYYSVCFSFLNVCLSFSSTLYVQHKP